MKKDNQSRMGRPTIGERPLTEQEIRARFNTRLRKAGGRQLTVRLKDAKHVRILTRFRDFYSHRSDTEALTALLEEALEKADRRMDYAENKPQ